MFLLLQSCFPSFSRIIKWLQLLKVLPSNLLSQDKESCSLTFYKVQSPLIENRSKNLRYSGFSLISSPTLLSCICTEWTYTVLISIYISIQCSDPRTFQYILTQTCNAHPCVYPVNIDPRALYHFFNPNINGTSNASVINSNLSFSESLYLYLMCTSDLSISMVAHPAQPGFQTPQRPHTWDPTNEI